LSSTNLLRPTQQFPTDEDLVLREGVADDKAGGIAIFESRVEQNPGNEMGRRRLLNMRNEILKTRRYD